MLESIIDAFTYANAFLFYIESWTRENDREYDFNRAMIILLSGV